MIRIRLRYHGATWQEFAAATERRAVIGGIFRLTEIGLLVAILVKVTG